MSGARLVYSAISSLDGYVADTDGQFDWAAPDVEVHAYVNDLERDVGTYLYGRRMYDVMRYWADPDPEADAASPAVADYRRIWQGADKIVHSRTLDSVTTPRTTLAQAFDPQVVHRMKASAERDLSIGGSDLAGQALRHGLVDEIHLFLNPVVVGRGSRALPDGWSTAMRLQGVHRFGSGVVHLHHALG